MKKYVKPELFFEQFELSQHIADCAWELLTPTKDTCSASPDPEWLGWLAGNNLFMNEQNGCSLIPGENYGKYCYQDGAGGINVFAS